MCESGTGQLGGGKIARSMAFDWHGGGGGGIRAREREAGLSASVPREGGGEISLRRDH